MAKVGFLRKAWLGWTSFAHKLGNFQARLMLTILYFFIIAPFCLVIRLFSDPLRLKKATPKGWIVSGDKAKDSQQDEIGRAKEQF